MAEAYTLGQIVSVARKHPFYCPNVEYPPSPDEIRQIASKDISEDGDFDLSGFPLITKDELIKTIRRLTADTNPRNGYRRSSYISITGGGSGGLPLIFATDSIENRNHRAAVGALARRCRVVEPGDIVLTVHVSGQFYRALDLTAEICENAGGTVFCAGHDMSRADVANAVAHYRVNVLTGDGSQILQFANFASSLPADQRAAIKLTKVIYTSEPLDRAQRSVIVSALGPVEICSMLGSAEAGAWAVASPRFTGEPSDDAMDFIYDTRMMKIEILPPAVLDDKPESGSNGEVSVKQSCVDGDVGIVVQTSLSRLRNPLLRYVSGDMGSLHPFPDASDELIPPEERQHLRVLRLYGRDRRFSFKWFAEYFEFQKIQELMRTDGWGVLQWQVILNSTALEERSLEIRLLRSNTGEQMVSSPVLVERLRKFFVVLPMNEHLFSVTFLTDLQGFERSNTGNKVMKFVDRVHSLDLASQFLEFLLQKDAPTTTLVICSTRDAFLEQLAISSRPHTQQQAPERGAPGHDNAQQHSPSFLANSISLIAKSQRIKLAFCPSLEVLRAYISTVQVQASTKQTESGGRPLLAILNLVAVHCGTPELSAQGLSRAFALVTEVAAREGMNLALCECKDVGASDGGSESSGARWDVQVPLLSASVRLGDEESAGTGRTVTVKRVAQKWFDVDQVENTADIMQA
ncbi:hypothetical protein FQN54_006183 [Arachnomyces sp. PD_36]|nr:hypothetical protein FQN54_006183 [Arachnomyces sp. PD_36]